MTPQNHAWVIYTLADPFTGEVRYVGVTNDKKRRLRRHINDAKSATKPYYSQRWILSLIGSGIKPKMRIVDIGTGPDWPFREQFWVRFFKNNGARLTNLTDGGEGCVGWSLSEEHKAKLWAARDRRTASMSDQERRQAALDVWRGLPQDHKDRFFAGGLHALPPDQRRMVAQKREEGIGADARSLRAKLREASMSTEAKKARRAKAIATRKKKCAETGAPLQGVRSRCSNKSGYPGVYLHPRTKRYLACIQLQGKLKHCGSFGSPTEAYAAVSRVALENGRNDFLSIPVNAKVANA